MKNKYLFQTMFTLILCWTFSFYSFGQTATANVGELRNGKAVVTDVKLAEKILRVGLSENAIVSNIEIGYAQYEKKYYLLCAVENDPVSGKALQLNTSGNVIYAAAGPGVEISCVGFNCDQCLPTLKGMKAKCVCSDSSIGPDTRCDMISKIVIGF